jgi:hypothetical protein
LNEVQVESDAMHPITSTVYPKIPNPLTQSLTWQYAAVYNFHLSAAQASTSYTTLASFGKRDQGQQPALRQASR